MEAIHWSGLCVVGTVLGVPHLGQLTALDHRQRWGVTLGIGTDFNVDIDVILGIYVLF